MAKDTKWIIFYDRFYRLSLPLTLGAESRILGIIGFHGL